MAERRLSIYSGPPIEAALAALGEGYDENRSGRLNTVCERYLAMVADELSRLELSKNEWCLILDANNDVEQYLGDTGGSTAMLWANIYDSPETISEKWDVDRDRLAARLRAMPRSTLIAIREACDRFWSRANAPTDNALHAAGIRPKE